jgi:hypothetical protein
MKRLKKTLLSLFTCVVILITTCIPVFAATTNSDIVSAPKEFTITSEMVDQNGNLSFVIDESYGFEGKITVNRNVAKVSTDDFKLTGRFYKTSDGSTISDFWLSASFYVSSNKVYIDSYDSRHTKRTGFFSGYKANVTDTTTSGEGTTSAKVRAEFELLLNGEPSPGTSETYLQVNYGNDKTWKISGNYDGAETP